MSALSAHITEWFHTRDFDSSAPDMSIKFVCDQFLKRLQKQNLELVIAEKEFRHNMCEALCVLYHSNLLNSKMRGPNKKIQKPSNWTSDAETIWYDYIHSLVFPYTFWNGVWSILKVGHWEHDVPTWREYFQVLMPMYVKRSVTVLSDAGLMFEDADGTLIEASEYDMEYEEYDDRY